MDFSRLKRSLEQKGYRVSLFDTAEEASEYLVDKIKDSTVGMGGSMTLKEMGLFEKLSKNNRVFWHWRDYDDMMPKQVLANAATAEIYLSSANGVAETGEIVNIDGNGNRVSATLYGHERVYFVVGRNKVAPTAAAAVERARNVAAPRNAGRLGRKTPCTEAERRCHDCNSPDRICGVMVMFYERPRGSEYEVVLIDEDLGY